MTHDDVRIGAHNISPPRRDRPDGTVARLQQKPFAISVVAPADAWQMLRKQRMKRMRHPH